MERRVEQIRILSDGIENADMYSRYQHIVNYSEMEALSYMIVIVWIHHSKLNRTIITLNIVFYYANNHLRPRSASI